jgi:hypothetical protein
MSATTPEGRWKKKVSEALKALGIWHYFPANNGYGKSGIPDVVAIVDGTFVGVEVKADANKKPTPLQLLRAKEIQEAGGFWFLVYSDNCIFKLVTWIVARQYKE